MENEVESRASSIDQVAFKWSRKLSQLFNELHDILQAQKQLFDKSIQAVQKDHKKCFLGNHSIHALSLYGYLISLS